MDMRSSLTLPEDEFQFENKAEPYDNLGPNYFAARTIVERFMKHFSEEHFKPLVDEFTNKLRDEVWSNLAFWLLSDTESNLQSEIWHRVDRSVDALLEGKPAYIQQYVMGKYGDVEIREAIARHIPKELQDQRVVDLEAKVAELENSLKYERERNRY